MNSKRELVSGGIFGLWATGKGQEFLPQLSNSEHGREALLGS